MRTETPEPDVLVVVHRPVFVPAFGATFFVAGLWVLARCILTERWTQNDVFGVFASLLLGGGLALFTLRDDRYRFDARRGLLEWVRRGVFGERRGEIPFEAIDEPIVEKGPASDDGLFRVAIRRHDQERFLLTLGFSSDERRKRQVAESIGALLERHRGTKTC